MAANYTQAWLEDPTSIRGLLVEVTAAIYNSSTSTWTDTVIYLSNIGYISGDSLTSYLPYLTGSLQTTETLSLDGSLSMSFGDIEIANTNGDLDTWLDSSKYIWVNRPIQVYLGDPRWLLETVSAIHDTANGGFQKIFDGIVSDIDSKDRSTLNIKVRDTLEKLNGPVSDNKLGTYGTWGQGQTNQDAMRPLIFGEVFNVSPVLVDPSQLEFMFHDTNVGSIITATTAGTNLLTCTSTNGFVQNAPIMFTGTTFGGITAGTTYYVKEVADGNSITLSSTPGGAMLTLTDASGTMYGNPASYIYVCTDDFNSTVYDTKEATATFQTTNIITMVNTTDLEVNAPIVFTGNVFGGLTQNQVYYIKSISSPNITISQTRVNGVAGSYLFKAPVES